ncbi:uncharacterized protein LOC111375260 [Olea europaea var. sylvestris]|uniref:uncharacterized protein LOC111375260 n=1 Tax=Olea europaea var. sylvestris TaxID=158386 RepID=UPI000C1D7F40|nr:uncharacterized protein LOC111375260 [Olea europaea var. sylvestris]
MVPVFAIWIRNFSPNSFLLLRQLKCGVKLVSSDKLTSNHSMKLGRDSKIYLEDAPSMVTGLDTNRTLLQQEGKFLSDKEVNPREHCNAIILRISKDVQESKLKEVVVPTPDPILVEKKLVEEQKTEIEFIRFLEVFKKLYINIPFVDALTQMPSYAKFLKEVMSKKRKSEEFETVKLIEECSAILLKKLPKKLKEPDNFYIPYTISGITFDKA